MSDDKTGETAQEAPRPHRLRRQRFREEVYPQQRELFEKLAYEQKPWRCSSPVPTRGSSRS